MENDSTLTLPQRDGPKPSTSNAVPHKQLDQNAPAEWQEELFKRAVGLSGVRPSRSRVSGPETRAFLLEEEMAEGPTEAFLVRPEFAHLHDGQDGSLHMTLPTEVIREVLAKGWGEMHPLAGQLVDDPHGGSGQLRVPSTDVMIFGPRDEKELESIWQLVQAAHAFAREESTRQAGWHC